MHVEVRGSTPEAVSHAIEILRRKVKKEGILQELAHREYFQNKRDKRKRKLKASRARSAKNRRLKMKLRGS